MRSGEPDHSGPCMAVYGRDNPYTTVRRSAGLAMDVSRQGLDAGIRDSVDPIGRPRSCASI
jgi:hypothetical protein